MLARRPGAAARAPALAAWLLKAAWFVCRRSQRAQRRRRQAEQAAAQRPSAGHRPEALDHLDDCLRHLPERQRAAVSLHYLAGKPAEEVADALGVSRDNAYQLLSRGLAALRSLLARRGVAVTSAGLAALLAGQAEAAGATTSSAIAITLGATPSANALHLANGAANAMTLAALAPAAAVAGLLIPLGLVTALIAADPTPPPTAKPTVTVQATPTTPDPTLAGESWAWLDQPVSCDFRETPLAEVVAFLHRTTRGNLVLDPTLGRYPGTVTLMVKDFKARDLLQWCERISNQKHLQTHGAYLLYRGDEPPAVGAGCNLAGAATDPALAARLGQRVTLEWQQVDAQTAFDDLRRQLALNLVVAPAALPLLRQARLTLSIADMRLDDLLAWTCHLSGLSLRFADGALQLDRAGAVPATKEDAPRF